MYRCAWVLKLCAVDRRRRVSRYRLMSIDFRCSHRHLTEKGGGTRRHTLSAFSRAPWILRTEPAFERCLCHELRANGRDAQNWRV